LQKRRVIKKRYSDFYAFYNQMVDTLGSAAGLSFPRKILGTLAEEELEERRVVLHLFMQQVLRMSMPEDAQAAVLSFMSEDSAVDLSPLGEMAVSPLGDELRRVSTSVSDSVKEYFGESDNTNGSSSSGSGSSSSSRESFLPDGLKGLLTSDSDDSAVMAPALRRHGVSVGVSACETIIDLAGSHTVFVMEVSQPAYLSAGSSNRGGGDGGESRSGSDGDDGDDGDGDGGNGDGDDDGGCGSSKKDTTIVTRTVKKRYRDFDAFYSQMVDTLGSAAGLSFPRKILGTLAEEELEERRAILNLFMQQLVRKRMSDDAQAEVFAFLSEDSDVREVGIPSPTHAANKQHSPTSDLALTLTQQGLRIDVISYQTIGDVVGSVTIFVMEYIKVVTRLPANGSPVPDRTTGLKKRRIVKKRYSDFDAFYSQMVDTLESAAGLSFPRKILGRLAEEELEERRVVLHLFMQQVLRMSLTNSIHPPATWR
jgi:ribosomal protein L20